MDMLDDLAQLNNERVEITKLVRKSMFSGNLCVTAICHMEGEPDIYVELWKEHRNMLDRAGFKIDWSQREPKLTAPIPVILQWKPEYRSLRIGEVVK